MALCLKNVLLIVICCNLYTLIEVFVSCYTFYFLIGTYCFEPIIHFQCHVVSDSVVPVNMAL